MKWHLGVLGTLTNKFFGRCLKIVFLWTWKKKFFTQQQRKPNFNTLKIRTKTKNYFVNHIQ